MKLPSSLEAVINAGRRRMRVLWAVATAQRVLPAAAGVGLALAVLARLRPWTWPEPAALVAPLAMLLVVAVGAVAMRIEPLVVARAIDNGSGSRDALATAFEVSESDPFGARVLERARASVPADLGTALPVRIDWRPWAGAAALIVATAALVLVANPQDAVRDRAAAER
ncbi:MAG: hypothetical protein KDB16_16350, partial [Acidimicrobiales bacterium]|nr:hypothetical protein [Acidimicrobiales bacterium]